MPVIFLMCQFYPDCVSYVVNMLIGQEIQEYEQEIQETTPHMLRNVNEFR